MAIPGTVTVTGVIAPTVTADTYPVTDAMYGIDGLRNVTSKTQRNAIPALRRRAGMIVGVSATTGTEYWSLLPEPWTFTDGDWTPLNTSEDIYTTGFTFDLGNYDLTIKRNGGLPNLTQSLSILASDLRVTGGTYDNSTGTATFTNNSGGTFPVTGFLVGYTDIYVTGGTISGETLTLRRNDGNNVPITGFVNANIYTTNGTLTDNRVVSTTSGYTLTFNPQVTFSGRITSQTATTATTIGTLFNPLIIASNSGNTLVGLDIRPSYSASSPSFTNISRIDLRTSGSSIVFGSGYGFGALYGSSNDGVVQISDAGSFRTRMMFRPSGNIGGFTGNWWSWIEQEGYKFRVYSGNYPTGQLSGQWKVGGPYDNDVTFGAFFNNNGNIIIGSTTDSGHKLDSYGVTRIQANFGVGTYSTPTQPSATTSTTGGVITGETTGTTYSYSIVGVDNLGYTTPASATRSVSLSGVTNSVQLTWTAISGISSYRVYRTNPWNGTTRFYSNILTNSFTDIGGVPASDNSSAPTANQTLKTNISSSGNLFVNSNGTFTGNVLIGGVSSGFEINTTSSTVPVTNVGIYRRPGNGNPTYFLEDEQGGAKDKWSFVRRGGYGLVREYYQGNSSIVNINLGWTNPNTNGWDANTLLIDPVINKTNVFSTTIRGIYYNPTLSGMTGVTHIAYQNTTGDNILNSLSGNTLIGTTVGDSSAILNVASTTQGFLPPRMTGTQVEAIGSPAEGLMVYATSIGLGGIITSKGWWGYDGLTWVKLN